MIISNRLLYFFLALLLSAFSSTAFADSRAEQAAKRVKPALVASLAEQKLVYGSPVFIRIFKAEKTLEVWIRKKDQYVLFHTYPICTYSGRLGPKTREGDNQAPEGFYRVGLNQLNPQSNYHLAFNLGYPNTYDRANGRTGDFLMVHGNCVSIGCYAMGDAAIEEIYTLMDVALHSGQKNIDVHIFPFRFDSTKIAWQTSEWQPFWSDLKIGFDAFNKTKTIPTVGVANRRYRIASP
ncbi:MAG: murein L,D-transpeptidase family protein [Arenimonas sp.]